jgi:transposase-like protein
MSKNRRTRRHFSPEDKIKILRQHLLEKQPVSTICDEHGLSPAQFYGWQKIFFENGAAAFNKAPDKRAVAAADQRQAALQEKLARKDEVIAEIMSEFIQLKKELGES